MRKDIEFRSQGSICRGWLYLPENSGPGPFPAIAMAHGFSGVKEMDLPDFAKRFSQHGFAVVLFDYRHFGASDCEPRGRLDPASQLEDYRNALSFLETIPNVDPNRLGVWGTSFSGAHALHLGAFEPRIKAVVSQVPAVDVQANARKLMPPEHLSHLIKLTIDNRRKMFAGEQSDVLPVVAPTGQPCILPSPESLEMLLHQQATIAPSWINEMTVDSFEKIMEYRPARSIDLIAPCALLMIVAMRDALTPPELALAAFQEAREPKRLLTFDGVHYDAYADPATFELCSSAAIDWFSQHLV